MPFATAQRLAGFTESIIREMTRVANRYGAINLSQGFPDFDPPLELRKAAERALQGPYHQYAITWGQPEFREALAAKQSRFMGVPVDPDQHLVVTCGGTEAMLVALMTVCNPGNSVIIFSPFYENYGADTILAGARPIYVPLRPPQFDFDPEALQAAFAQRPKAIVVCNPSNPCGKVFTESELRFIGELAEQAGAFIITDEVYEHIVYPPHRHTYAAALPGLFNRTLTVGSLSKTYAITGWRLGFVLAAPEIISGARKVHDFLTVGAAHPLQVAAVTALRFDQSYYDQLARDYTARRELFIGYLQKAGLSFVEPQGAYYVLVDISEFGQPDDTQFCHWLAKEIGVAAVPGSSFFAEPVKNLIRFHFAKRDETLREAGERLLELRNSARTRPDSR
ncbi:MAG: aminotransferase class I/II-fold pyridoxal phosphate-dependent enzyme [Verrucomicrobia bacterium]|nr:aminotransferase class I/II-fold pyridoxal phosphate-dependent enzyme [Verrucomicrobiota bacterium]